MFSVIGLLLIREIWAGERAERARSERKLSWRRRIGKRSRGDFAPW